ncbi:MAG: TonB-dependent receptor [Proteobacteria bacterium]|nr:MAG: TonB-dependent receptor [Pseudomonadota bacterium]
MSTQRGSFARLGLTRAGYIKKLRRDRKNNQRGAAHHGEIKQMISNVTAKCARVRAEPFHWKTNVHAGSACGMAVLVASVMSLPPALLLASPAVMAQGSILEEVLVTARKREENVLEIPESVSTFSGTMVEQANINGLEDIGLLVPNLFMSRRADGFPNVSIRGLGGFGNTQGVGFYLDGVQMFSDASSRFGDLERIEVLKGPQGILYGGANIGGAIKFVAKRPDAEAFSSKVKFRAGEDDYYDVDLQANIPLGGTWAARVFGFFETDDSFLVNPGSTRLNGGTSNLDKDVGETEEFGFRVAVAGDFDERFSVYATVRYNELDGPNNVWNREFNGNFTYSDVVDTSFNPRHERDTLAGSVELALEFDRFTITSITSYTETNSDRESDLDISPEFILDLFRPHRLNVLTEELRFTSTDAGPWQWQAGVYFLEYRRKFDSDLLVRGGFSFLDPDFGPAPPLLDATESALAVALPFEDSHREREQYAGYANSSYRWNDFEIAAGFRVDRWEAERTNRDSGVSGRQAKTELLGRASLAWYVNDRSMLYANASQGFEPGDFNLTSFAGESALFAYGAEHATQYEIGYKGRFLNDRLIFTAAGFLIDYRDRQFELQAAAPDGTVIEGIVNVGDSENWGAEADVLFSIDEHWTLSAGFGYIDAEWDGGTVSPITGLDISGQTPPNTVDWSATGALDYTAELRHEMRLHSRLQVRYKGEASTNAQFFDAPGDDFPFWDNPDFTVVDLGAWIEWRNWEFGLHVENLFDEEYYIDVQEFPNFGGTAVVNPAGVSPGAIIIGTLEQPRRVVGSIQYRF